MRLGVNFGDLQTDLRAELRRSSNLGHDLGDVTHLQRAINAEYFRLYDDYDWPHLIRQFTRVPMVAGQRYYDLPAQLDWSRIERVDGWWNGRPHDVLPGIGIEEYAQFDSVGDERSDPVLKFDIRNQTGTPQIEVWPVPASALCSIELTGPIKMDKLVDDADVCLLDAEAVILFAAWKLSVDDNKKSAEAAATSRLRQIRARIPETRRVRMGLGESNRIPQGRAVVRVS
jgi:hypothetical protein